jgi:hypothetical protein
MREEITIEIGNLYAELHRHYERVLGETYDQRVRNEFENFIHTFNQQVEREEEMRKMANEENQEEIYSVDEEWENTDDEEKE